MQAADYWVLLAYFLGLIGMGFYFSRIEDTGQMFAAGGRSPWWVSGLSAFMTMFSAGTFVVWGGIAYSHGLVAVSICMSLGLSALLAGWLVAGHWKRLGVSSAAEFLELRFSPGVVKFYLWLQGIVSIFTMGGAVYALSVMVCALVPLAPGHPLADPATGHLSVAWMSVAVCVAVALVTMVGGLWAVLMTDVLQFLILMVSVVVVVPLLFLRVGGIGEFVRATPEGFLRPVTDEFSAWFLVGWVLVHFLKVGAEWAFVQRFVCVPSPQDARKSAWLFGVMYLVSPLIWMLPPMIFRTLRSDADPEQAYILACQQVLPAGLMGLMVAAMTSATASTATTLLNVYAGAFTQEVYRRRFRPMAGEKELVFAGRVLTILLGGLVLAGAFLIPAMGTYTGYILSITAILSGPLLLPTLWGLFSARIGPPALWTATLGGIVAGVAGKTLLVPGGAIAGWPGGGALVAFAQAHPRLLEIGVGIGIPLLVLLVAQWRGKGRVHDGWERVLAHARKVSEDTTPAAASGVPAVLCAVSIGALALLMAVLAVTDAADRPLLLGFAAILAIIAGACAFLARRIGHAKTKSSVP